MRSRREERKNNKQLCVYVCLCMMQMFVYDAEVCVLCLLPCFAVEAPFMVKSYDVVVALVN